MLREQMAKKNVGAKNNFRWRGGEISRIEGFSDAVFAFAVTLLVVSLEVPTTFDDLLNTMRGFIAFAICFTMLILIWYEHYAFFRRYGLQNNYILVLNAALLFVALFYVYPLKFLFTVLVGFFFGIKQEGEAAFGIRGDQVPGLMIIYGLGFLALFLIFLLMHVHAYRKRGELELTDAELLMTRSSIHSDLIYVTIAFVSIVISALGGYEDSKWAGFIYALLGPLHALNGTIMGRRVEKLWNKTASTQLSNQA
jgi:uncharacterized membrane protein